MLQGPTLHFPWSLSQCCIFKPPTVSITEWILGSKTGLLKNSFLCNEGCKELEEVQRRVTEMIKGLRA